MTRRSSSAISTSPVMVGVVTVLIAIVTVFLAYNANEGLPFVPTRTFQLELPDGARLARGDEVRRGGTRIGVVTGFHTTGGAGGTVAVATLKLDEDESRLPVDSVFTVRARSLLGAKYVDVRRGASRSAFPDNATIPAPHTRIPVQIDDVTGTFDAPTREHLRGSLTGLGGGLAGRGTDINETIANLPSLLPRLGRVTGTLADRRTHLAEFIGAVDRTARALAPVAGRQAHLFGVATSARSCATPRRWPRPSTAQRRSCRRRCPTSTRPCAPGRR